VADREDQGPLPPAVTGKPRLREASGQDLTATSTLGVVLQSPQLGEPGASALESLDSRGGFPHGSQQ
jgi:hypothetical protein